MGHHRINFEVFNPTIDERSRDLAESFTKSDLKDMRELIVRGVKDSEAHMNIEAQWNEWSFTVEEACIVNPVLAGKAMEVAKASSFGLKFFHGANII